MSLGGQGSSVVLEVGRREKRTQMQQEATSEVLIRGVQNLHHAKVSYGKLKLGIVIDLQILNLGNI